ncbi:MAG: phage major capsid protein [Porticoccaceae bacterium]
MNVSQHRGIRAVYANSSTAELVAAELDRWNAELAKFRRQTEAGISAATQKAEAANLNLLEIEQKVADYALRTPGANVGNAGAALAAKLTKAPEFQDVASRRSTKTSINVASNLLLPVSAAITYDNAGLGVSENVGIVSPVQRTRWFRQRLNSVPASGGSVEFSRETGNVQNNADVIGAGSPFQHEGVDKPESVLEWELIDAKIPTIATWIEASRQILSDVAELGNVIDTRLRYFLELKLEQQLIAGTGVGAQMKGLTHADNRVAFTPTSGDTAIDSINRALGVLADTYEVQPDLLVISNTDLRAMQRIKDGGSQYIWGSPGGAGSRGIWEIEIHATPAMPVGKFAVTSTEQVGTFRPREDARIEIGYRNAQFTQNLVTVLAELRALFTVERPTATLYGSLTL